MITPSLRLSGSCAFIDGDFDTFPTFLGLDVHAENCMLPESAATLVLDWDVFEIEKGTVNLQLVGNFQDESVSIATAQAAHTSAQFPAPVSVSFEQRKNQSRTLVDARLSWIRPMDNGGALNISLWGRNITDEEYRTFSFNFGPTLGLNLSRWGSSATLGVDVRYQF